MKKLMLLTVMLLLAWSAAAKPAIDSLTRLLLKHPAADAAKVDLLNQLGYEYWIVDPAQSEKLGTEALALAGRLRYPKGAAFAHRVVGVAWWARGNYLAALRHLTKGLAGYQQLKDALGVAAMHNNIGLVYQDQRNYPAALRCFERAQATYANMGEKRQEAGTLGNIGSCYFHLGDYPRAERLFRQELQQNQALGRRYGVASAYTSLGELALARNQPGVAGGYLAQSVRLRRALEDQEGLAQCYSLLGKAALAQGQYGPAGGYLHRGLAAAAHAKSLKWRMSLHEALKNLEAARGNYPQALAWFEAYAQDKDSLVNQAQYRQLAQLQTEFETRQQEQKLRVQQEELRNLRNQARLRRFQRNTLLAGLCTLALVAYLVVSRQKLRIRKDKALLARSREALLAREALAQAERENARLQERKLTQELELKNKKLTSYSINFIQKTELLAELKSGIDQLKKNKDIQPAARQLSGLHRLAGQNSQIDREWEEFKLHFEQVHKDFYRLLKAHHPDLTNHELKLCTLVKLTMSLKESANLMGISPESVKKARHRLRKKLSLPAEASLTDYILTLETQGFPPTVQVA